MLGSVLTPLELNSIPLFKTIKGKHVRAFTIPSASRATSADCSRAATAGAEAGTISRIKWIKHFCSGCPQDRWGGA